MRENLRCYFTYIILYKMLYIIYYILYITYIIKVRSVATSFTINQRADELNCLSVYLTAVSSIYIYIKYIEKMQNAAYYLKFDLSIK